MSEVVTGSTPTLQEFDPRIIPFQMNVIKHVRKEFSYEHEGVAEVLLSGSVGSAKSVLAAHLIVTHLLLYPGSQFMVVRRVLKDLKNTIWRVILSHFPMLREYYNKSETAVFLPNGSILYGSSYDDGNYEKFRSYELSGFAIEEAVEARDVELYDELIQRVNRLPHVKENLALLITNPGSPSHWIYEKFINAPTSSRKVFYSLTEQNPFLKESYIRQLKATLDPKTADRMLRGKWIEIGTEVIYYAYDKQTHFRDQDYHINPNFPVHIAWDFNIGVGKPMSVAMCQYINDTFHWFSECIVEGARTLSILEELAERGILDLPVPFIINGDATGASGSSKSILSDYEIIQKYLSNYRRADGHGVQFKMMVPKSNPPIKTRHNLVNAYLKNDLGQVRMFIYRGCKKVDEGLRLTALKKGGSFIEDDSKDYQHVTTAIGYCVWITANQPKTRATQRRT